MHVSACRYCAFGAACFAASFSSAAPAVDPVPASTSLNAEPAIAPFATVTAEAWRNRGGLHSSGWWNSLVDAGAEAALHRFGGPADSSLSIQFHWACSERRNEAFSDDTGAFNPVSGIMAADHFRVFNLYYRQSWASGRYAVKAGQIALDDDFMVSDGAAEFLNSAFGAMPSQVGLSLCERCEHGGAFPIYGVAAPGMWFQMKPTETFSWQAGLYYGAPGSDSADNFGFDWRHAPHTGPLVLLEGSWSYSVLGRAGTLRVGVCDHGGDFDNFDRQLAGEPDGESRGVASAYVLTDLVLSTNAAGEPRFNAFGRFGVSPQHDRSIVVAYGDAGVIWHAPWAGRAHDIAGVAISATHFGGTFRAAAPEEDRAATETTWEVTYRAQVTEHVSLQADVQWLHHPVRDETGRRNDATVLGLRARYTF